MPCAWEFESPPEYHIKEGREMTRIDTIFLDMDGVLADYERSVAQVAGVPFHTLERSTIREIASTDGFFENLLPTLEFGHLIHHIHNHIDCDVFVLSATGRRDPVRVHEEKNKWLDKWYTYYQLSGRHFVHHSNEKCYYANGRALLIDDRPESIDPFIRAGGHGILHTDGFNTVHKLKEIFGYYEANPKDPENNLGIRQLSLPWTNSDS